MREKSNSTLVSTSSAVELQNHSGQGEQALGLSRSRTLRSTLYEMGGYGLMQVLRLASNIILSRLLFPAAFGLASTVSVILTGLVMLSDMGIQQFLIQSPRGAEENVKNTAFTFQAARGMVLALLMVVLAYPASWFFKEPQLVPLIYIGSIQLVATGFRSTSLYTLRRKLDIGWITVLELVQYILTLGIMVPWALIKPSVYPLVAGTSISACVHAAATHILPRGDRNRFHWDKEAYREMSRFGRWIFGSSSVTFLGSQIDRVFYGRFLGMAWLGVYSVAFNLSEAVSSLVNRLIAGIVYPVLSHASREPDKQMSSVYYRIRLRLDAVFITGIGFLAGAGGWIIRSLWDDRYMDAAWILRLLCVKAALSVILSQGENCLTAMGKSRYGFWRSMIRFFAVVVGLPLGWRLWGVLGVLWAAVLAELPAVFIIWPALRRENVLRIHREMFSLALFLLGFGIGAAILPFLPEIHVRRR